MKLLRHMYFRKKKNIKKNDVLDSHTIGKMLNLPKIASIVFFYFFGDVMTEMVSIEEFFKQYLSLKKSNTK